MCVVFLTGTSSSQITSRGLSRQSGSVQATNDKGKESADATSGSVDKASGSLDLLARIAQSQERCNNYQQDLDSVMLEPSRLQHTDCATTGTYSDSHLNSYTAEEMESRRVQHNEFLEKRAKVSLLRRNASMSNPISQKESKRLHELQKDLMPLTNANLEIYREQEKLNKLAAQQNLDDAPGGIASKVLSIGNAGHSSANEEENSGHEDEENVSSTAICVRTSADLVESESESAKNGGEESSKLAESPVNTLKRTSTQPLAEADVGSAKRRFLCTTPTDSPVVIVEKRKVGRPKGSTRKSRKLSSGPQTASEFILSDETIEIENADDTMNEGSSKGRETRQKALHTRLIREHQLEQNQKAPQNTVAQAAGDQKKQAVRGRSINSKKAKVNFDSNTVTISSDECDSEFEESDRKSAGGSKSSMKTKIAKKTSFKNTVVLNDSGLSTKVYDDLDDGSEKSAQIPVAKRHIFDKHTEKSDLRILAIDARVPDNIW